MILANHVLQDPLLTEQSTELHDELAFSHLRKIDDAVIHQIILRENGLPAGSDLVLCLSFVDENKGHVRKFYWKGCLLLQTVWDNGDIRITRY